MSTTMTAASASGLARTLEDMPSPMRTAVDKMLTICRRMAGGTVNLTWQLGEVVYKLTSNPKVYGEHSVESAAKALAQGGFGEYNYNALTDARHLYECFPDKAELEKLLARRTVSDKVITLTHLKNVAGLLPQQRKPYIERVFAEDLTTRELELAVQAGTGRGGRGGGRQPNPPKTPGAGLHQIQTFAGQFDTRRLKLWDKHVFEKLSKVSSDQITEQTHQQLEQTKTSLQAAEAAIAHIKEELASVEARITTVLAKKDEAAAAAVAETAAHEQNGHAAAATATTRTVKKPAAKKPATAAAAASTKKATKKAPKSAGTSQERLAGAAARRRAPQNA
jgi:exonuclease VII small subunit